MSIYDLFRFIHCVCECLSMSMVYASFCAQKVGQKRLDVAEDIFVVLSGFVCQWHAPHEVRDEPSEKTLEIGPNYYLDVNLSLGCGVFSLTIFEYNLNGAGFLVNSLSLRFEKRAASMCGGPCGCCRRFGLP